MLGQILGNNTQSFSTFGSGFVTQKLHYKILFCVNISAKAKIFQSLKSRAYILWIHENTELENLMLLSLKNRTWGVPQVPRYERASAGPIYMVFYIVFILWGMPIFSLSHINAKCKIFLFLLIFALMQNERNDVKISENEGTFISYHGGCQGYFGAPEVILKPSSPSEVILQQCRFSGSPRHRSNSWSICKNFQNPGREVN